MYLLYRHLIPVYFFVLRIAAWFRKDAKEWVEGRKNWKRDLLQFTEINPLPNSKRIWMHVASLGEFEQGRVLLESIRLKHPEHQIVLSFFSPSGYNKQKKYDKVDYVCYFPSDCYWEIRDFIACLNPTLVLFVKYDFWFNCLDVLRQRKIPFCFVSMILRPDHFLLNALNASLLNKLKPAHQLFLQNQETYNLLKDKSFSNIQIAGDTRWDRVDQIARENKPIPGLHFFSESEKIWIAGSIWPHDLSILREGVYESIQSGWKIILVPHKTDEENIQFIETNFSNQTIRYSQLNSNTAVPILIMDQIGYLAALYRFAQFAYIGGGFGVGIHNILEVLIYKIPVCFGPRFHKFPEAGQSIKSGMGFVINSSRDFVEFLHSHAQQKNEDKTHFDAYFVENLGASTRIYDYLKENKLV